MSDSNTTDFTNPSTFILMGIPGLEAAHVWISIPFCTIYTIAILGNVSILFIVKIEPSLHGPIYYFLCMLSVTDLVLSTSTMPKMLNIFWFNSTEIDFSACLTQMYFIHCFSAMESGILVAMALDRYVAICHPLRHSTILTNSVVAKIGLAMVLRSSILAFPYPFLARCWPYCRTNIIPHSYCEHIAVVNLACADTRLSSYYGLFILFSVICLDVFFYHRVIYPDPQGHLQPPHKGCPTQDFWDLRLPPLCHLGFLHSRFLLFHHTSVWPQCALAFPHSHGQCVPFGAPLVTPYHLWCEDQTDPGK
ncbi:unnamed protein product, partial [Lepidochelys olivacea]